MNQNYTKLDALDEIDKLKTQIKFLYELVVEQDRLDISGEGLSITLEQYLQQLGQIKHIVKHAN